MNAYRKPPAPAAKPSPADCWRWITPEDVARHALAAYYRAQREATPPKDYPAEHAAGWSSAEDFARTLVQLIELRVLAQAHSAGVPGFDLACPELGRWLDRPPHADMHVSEVDPELWQEMQAGGAR